jgi:hypothetical protein
LDYRDFDGCDWLLCFGPLAEMVRQSDCFRCIRKNPMLNFGLLKNPANWIIIILMLVIAAMAGHLTLSYLGVEPTT